ncbi:RDD family protein [Gilvimarinus xylanilyticus]|uniref:RDD family protein n=1 Tax=Gilvimarinus xylanilyticus TaxID=2944139 RepID=A0A9X2I7N7_9GAMM|nr:RDD family protein [Gilvimarinus xylanilyticus]MCP8900332.1 RDD family protein [Gilvimarinus xylanilyticus]
MTQSAPPDDTQEFITPHALNINTALIGLTLASPWKRLAAIAVDLAFILALSVIPAGFLFLALVLLVLGWRNRRSINLAVIPQSGRARMRVLGKLVLMLAGIALLLATLLGAVVWLKYGERVRQLTTDVVFYGVDLSNEVSAGQALGVNAFLFGASQDIRLSDCTDLDCWENELFYLAVALPDMGISRASAGEIYRRFALLTPLAEPERNSLSEYLSAHYGAQMSDRPDAQEPANAAPNFSPLGWLLALGKDMGLGVSWTAFYFTLFHCVAGGCTPGKRLFGTRVIKLDGSALTIWDSFFRFGGYAAGITTGLLGYLQIYWDPNRQAIQDKIAASVVIDHHRPALTPEQARKLG